MKTPIEPGDIRFGDLVRWESDTSDTAREFRHTDPNSQHAAPGTYYLLDRPTPSVELPSEPTLGWLSWYAGEESSGLGIHRTSLGIFHRMGNGDITDEAAAGAWGTGDVVAFVPATAVPTDALDELRQDAFGCTPGSIVGRFLAAIDKAAQS